MAKLSVVGTPFDRVLLQDLDKKQQLVDQAINPPGQERYIHPIDDDGELTAYLEGLGASALDSELDTFIANTVGSDDISISTITSEMDSLTGVSGTTSDEANDVQDLISYDLIETGKMLLSFNDGVLRGLLDEGWIKVFTDAGNALFSL